MMRRVLIILALTAFIPTVPIAAATAPKHANAPVVNIVATADQKFVPDHVVLRAGKAATLRFTSTGGVHGVASPELGIPSTMIAPKKPVSVVVTPAKPGIYKIPCSIVCGPGHADMVLTVEVKK